MRFPECKRYSSLVMNICLFKGSQGQYVCRPLGVVRRLPQPTNGYKHYNKLFHSNALKSKITVVLIRVFTVTNRTVFRNFLLNKLKLLILIVLWNYICYGILIFGFYSIIWRHLSVRHSNNCIFCRNCVLNCNCLSYL